MKMVLFLDGLDCEQCADKIESYIQRQPGVKGACLMFVTKRLIIDCEDGAEDRILEDVVNAAGKAQGSVTVKRVQRPRDPCQNSSGRIGGSLLCSMEST